ncbi:biotin transporter BioY [Treponema sp.]|uniref:biotin transporter BioY n=1 Tax=Treponema sp. TaxID=166 RepID=UPI003F0BDBD6
MKTKKGTGIVLTSLFAALISAACFIQIPLPGGIPIIIQDMMCMLSGMLLGPIYGALSVIVFLILGCLGLPVFSGKGGVQHLIAGPTGGFLFAYVAGAVVSGLILALIIPASKEHSKVKSITAIAVASVVSTAVIFAGGILGFMHVTGSGIEKTLAAVLVPFIPGNIIKILIMIPAVFKFRPVIFRYTNLA